MNADREREILREYEAALARSEQETKDLSEIVDRVRRRLATHSDHSLQSVNGSSHVRRRYAGRTSLPGFLLDLMSDGQRRTLDEIEQAVKDAPDFADRVPTRNTIATRLSEITKKHGTFDKLAGGGYQKMAR